MINNFAYIAKNITYIDEVVTANRFPLVTSTRMHYAVVGAVDACMYIANGQMRALDLADAIVSAETKSVSVGATWEPANDQGVFGDEVDDFVCFIMQMEALIFSLSTRVADRDIVHSVIRMRRAIERAVLDARVRVRKRGWPSKWSRNTHRLLATPTFVDFIHQVGKELRNHDSRYKAGRQDEAWQGG